MEFKIDKCLYKTRKELNNIVLTTLRKLVPDYFEIDYSKNVASITISSRAIDQAINIGLTQLACRYTIGNELFYKNGRDTLQYIVESVISNMLKSKINCYYFIRGNHKHTLYIVSPDIFIEKSAVIYGYNFCLCLQAAMVIFVRSLDKIPISNKLKAIVELESKGYYKTKMSIKETEKLCLKQIK